MAIDFPNSPATNEIFTSGGKTWVYDGTVWTLRSSLAGPGGITSTELANSSVTSDKIADGAIVNADINASAAIAYSKLALSNSVLSSDLNTDVQLGYRNVVINGAMQVAQRGTSVTGITASGYNTADRWITSLTTLGTWTQTVENDAPTGSGFRKSLKMLCTTADAAPAAGDFLLMAQNIEGQNVQQFLKGTASAKQFSLSFWVKSNATGTYIAEIRDPDNNRSVSASYTISAADTWEKKTITFPADTTGVLDNDNATSISLIWWCGAGTTYTSGTLATTWETLTSANRAVGQTNLAAATNNYWQVTGVQLEAGAVATPFEFEDYGTTLRKCQRYYQKSYAIDTVPGTVGTVGIKGGGPMFTSAVCNGTVRLWESFSVVMRGTPTVTSYDSAGNSSRVNLPDTTTNKTMAIIHETTSGFQIEGYAGESVSDARMYYHYVASAEL
jgi:hypothetical protein